MSKSESEFRSKDKKLNIDKNLKDEKSEADVDNDDKKKDKND